MSKNKQEELAKADAIIDKLSTLTSVEPLQKIFEGGHGWTHAVKPVKGIGNTVAFSHRDHGTVSVYKNPESGLHEVRHNGAPVRVKGTPPAFGSAKDALNHANQYLTALSSGKIRGSHLQNAPSGDVRGELAGKSDPVEKSNYGPKKGGQYTTKDNVKRKANNVGDQAIGAGPNVNVKAISTKPGQQSAKAQAKTEAAKYSKLNRGQPVTTFTPEQIEEEKKKRAAAGSDPLKSSVDNEFAVANQLAKMMQGKSMLGNRPPAQPTDEEMFGRFVTPEEEVKKAEDRWQNGINNWLVEASKPIKQFASEAEEQAYWASIKVSDRDDSKSGF
jgi:hypothetical protein